MWLLLLLLLFLGCIDAAGLCTEIQGRLLLLGQFCGWDGHACEATCDLLCLLQHPLHCVDGRTTLKRLRANPTLRVSLKRQESDIVDSMHFLIAAPQSV